MYSYDTIEIRIDKCMIGPFEVGKYVTSGVDARALASVGLSVGDAIMIAPAPGLTLWVLVTNDPDGEPSLRVVDSMITSEAPAVLNGRPLRDLSIREITDVAIAAGSNPPTVVEDEWHFDTFVYSPERLTIGGVVPNWKYAWKRAEDPSVVEWVVRRLGRSGS